MQGPFTRASTVWVKHLRVSDEAEGDEEGEGDGVVIQEDVRRDEHAVRKKDDACDGDDETQLRHEPVFLEETIDRKLDQHKVLKQLQINIQRS